MESQGRIEFIEFFKYGTRLFVFEVIKLFQSLPKSEEAKVIGGQLLRSATSMGLAIGLYVA